MNYTVCGLGMNLIDEWIFAECVSYWEVVFAFMHEVISS